MTDNSIKLDKKDLRLLYELEENCRRSLNQLSKKVGVSKQVLHYRLERLIREEAILQFITVIDYSRLGYVNHEVWFQLKEMKEEKKKEFLTFLINHPRIRWLVKCGGKFDYAMSIMATDVVSFSELLEPIFSRYPNFVQNHFVTISKGVYSYPKTHLVHEHDEKRKGLLLFSGIPKKMVLDDVEYKILSLLAKDARISTVELARRVKSTPITVRKKIKRLEKEEVIQGYKAILQPTKIGIQNYELLITTQNLSKEKEKELESYCRLNPYIQFLLKIVGRWDLNIAFDARDNEHFQQILSEIRTRFDSIIKEYEYVPILHVYKFDYAPIA